MNRANAAVARGEARPLREIVGLVQAQYPGRLIEVGFNERAGVNVYWLRMVAGNGSLQTVTVEAATGLILGVKGC